MYGEKPVGARSFFHCQLSIVNSLLSMSMGCFDLMIGDGEWGAGEECIG
jgi:hypothetical protein